MPLCPMNTTELDDDLQTLRDHATEWARLELDTKIDMLRTVLDRTVEVADDQVETALDHQGVEPGTPEAAEEWLGGILPMVRAVRAWIETLTELQETGEPPLDESKIRYRDDGRLAVEVFPDSIWDRLQYAGFRAEVWMEPEIETIEQLRQAMGAFYRRDAPEGEVELVLGAGNVASIPPLDVLDKMYVEGRVCMLKMNPVNDYLQPYFGEIFRDYIEAGYLRTTGGGAETGAYLCEHDDVEHIHITGSDRTHDAIVYGTGEEGEQRKREDDRRIDKPITSELGNVSPVIVVPGPWDDEDIQFHAENIATQLVNNAGFNCNAVRVLVMPEEWEHRGALLDAIEEVLSDLGPRPAYYPGAEERFEEFVGSHDDVAILGERESEGDDGAPRLPWAILRDVEPEQDALCFQREAFCGVACETRLPGDDAAAFLGRAVDFCNDRLWGTLNASLVVHPETERQLDATLEEAIDDLRYGSVVINHWPALGYALGVTPWGAYPGSTYRDIQSGIGFVHNTQLFDRPRKSVVEGPFRVSPKPPWFATHESAHEIAPKLVDFEHAPSVLGFLSVAWRALWG